MADPLKAFLRRLEVEKSKDIHKPIRTTASLPGPAWKWASMRAELLTEGNMSAYLAALIFQDQNRAEDQLKKQLRRKGNGK